MHRGINHTKNSFKDTIGWRPFSLRPQSLIPRIAAHDVVPLVEGVDLWDCWPLARTDGSTARISGREFWFFLSAPRLSDPHRRHAVARIRMMSRTSAGWRDHGPVLAHGSGPGSREWAGCAVICDDGEAVTLFYTAAGDRDAPDITFSQRIVAATARMDGGMISDWQAPAEVIAADGVRYAPADDTHEPAPGMLKAFRDPFHFRDPATGDDHLVFTASAGWSQDPHNGVIGLATLSQGRWELRDPLIEAIGVNNELERPQILFRGGLYYLFWSTQTHTFAPGAPAGPTGLYGMVGNTLRGTWRPVNGSGLVAANPGDVADQSYSWCVTGEDEVWSFVNRHELGLRAADEAGREPFGGTVAPVFSLKFEGETVTLA